MRVHKGNNRNVTNRVKVKKIVNYMTYKNHWQGTISQILDAVGTRKNKQKNNKNWTKHSCKQYSNVKKIFKPVGS